MHAFNTNIDIIGPLPPSQGNRYLLTMVDRFSRWPEVVPMKDAITNSCANRAIQLTGLQPKQSRKNFFLQRTKPNRALFAARVVVTVLMVALHCRLSRISIKKEMIKSTDGFDVKVMDHYPH